MSTTQGTVFKIKVESDLVSLKGVVVDVPKLQCGLLYRIAILNEVLYVASYDDDGEISTVNFQDKRLAKGWTVRYPGRESGRSKKIHARN